MNLNLVWWMLSLVGAFLVALALAPIFIKIMTKQKVKQTVLGYVEQHSSKTGTPTMGGWIFIIPSIAFGLACFSTFSLVLCISLLAYGFIGFIDDFLKVKNNRNLGLKAYQKIIFQLAAAAILATFCFKNEFIGSSIHLPFTDVEWQMGWFYIPFCMIGFVALSNGVNLTDGLDGLAGFTMVSYFATFSILCWFCYVDNLTAGKTAYAQNLLSLAICCSALVGSLLGYLCFNAYPSKIMMGDTGSLALGGAASAVAFFSKEPILIFFVGIMAVVSCISVIVQVLVFKMTKKRVFKMAPFHHHLELCGVHESKIVVWYFVASIIGGLVSVLAARII